MNTHLDLCIAGRRIARLEAGTVSAACLALSLLTACIASEARADASLTTVAQTRSLTLESDTLIPDGGEAWIGQTLVGTTLSAGLTRSLSLVVSGGLGSSGLEKVAGGTDITAPIDTRAKLFYRLAGDRLLLGAGIVVPTGRDAFDQQEITTAQWTWNPLCGFPLKRFGEGLGGDFSAAAALPLGEHAILGFGAGYYSRGEYTLLSAEESRYRPGAEISSTAGIDFRGEKRTLRIAATYRGYATDELNGEAYLDQGDQLEFGATAITGGERFSGTIDARAITKATNELHGLAESLPTTDLSSNSYFVSGRLGWAVSSRFSLFGDASWSKFTGFAVGDQDINGSAITFGPGIGWRPSRTVEASVRAGYAVGGTDDNVVDFTGYDLQTMLSVRR